MVKSALGGVNQLARRPDQHSFVLAKLNESGCGFAGAGPAAVKSTCPSALLDLDDSIEAIGDRSRGSSEPHRCN